MDAIEAEFAAPVERIWRLYADARDHLDVEPGCRDLRRPDGTGAGDRLDRAAARLDGPVSWLIAARVGAALPAAAATLLPAAAQILSLHLRVARAGETVTAFLRRRTGVAGAEADLVAAADALTAGEPDGMPVRVSEPQSYSWAGAQAAIGPAVNLVSRLERLCRPLGRSVLISGSRRDAATDSGV